MSNKRLTDEARMARFESRLDRSGACWLWTGAKSFGYGTVWTGERTAMAHRWFYEQHNGTVPAGMQVDHMCHNRACVRLDHLQVVTPRENQENRSGAVRGTITGVRGVTWGYNRYVVQVKSRGVLHLGGRFTSLAEAERAAIALRNRLHTNNLADRAVSA